MDASKRYLSRYQALLRFPNLVGAGGVYKTLQSNFEDLRKVVEDGSPYCAISVFVPSEILNALNVHYLPLEPVIATASQFGIVTELQDIREKVLVFDTSCCGGQSLLALYERNILPLPKYFLACSHMCDDSLKTFNFVARYYGVPLFNLDVPYRPDDHAAAYLAAQLRDMTEFICGMEGISFDLDSLKETVAVSNRTNRFRHELFSRSKTASPVFRMFDTLPTYPLYSKFGRKEVETIYADLADEIQTRISAERWAFQDGCYRILWLGMIPLAFPRFLAYLESLKFGFPMTELMLHSDFEEMDAKAPFEGIARKVLNYPLVGCAQRRVDRIGNVVDEYGIEGVIHFNHRGCIAFNGDNFILSEYCKRRNIPFLVLEGDIADKKYCSEDKLQEAVTNFRNVLEVRHGRK